MVLPKCPLCGFDCRGPKKGTIACIGNFPNHVVNQHPEELSKLIKFEDKVRKIAEQAQKETGLPLMGFGYWRGSRNIFKEKEISD